MFHSRRGPWLALVLFVCVCPRIAAAQSVTLAWDPSVDASVVGYQVRFGTSAGVYPQAKDAGASTSTILSGLAPGTTYYAVVEAYTAARQYSDPSNMVSFVVPSCGFSMNPPTVTTTASAGNGSITVTATSTGCAWTARANSYFFSFTGTGGTGTSTIGYSLDPNYSTLVRAGTATLAGLTFSLTQNGAGVDTALVARERARSDFNGDGYSDLLWQDVKNGYVAAWLLQGSHTTRTPAGASHQVVDPQWRVAGTGDFNADGHPDIVWHHRTSGALYLWYMNGVNRIGHAAFSVNGIADSRWKIAGVGDFNDDSKPDLVWQHETAGWLAVWMLDGTRLIQGVDMTPGRVVDTRWRIEGVADFNNDSQPDMLFRHGQTGELALWIMNGTTRTSYQQLTPGAITDREWRIASLMDVDGDQTTDIVWQHDTAGWIAVWYMNGTKRTGAQSFPVAVETNWKIVGSR